MNGRPGALAHAEATTEAVKINKANDRYFFMHSSRKNFNGRNGPLSRAVFGL
jgi:hypothetical protein